MRRLSLLVKRAIYINPFMALTGVMGIAAISLPLIKVAMTPGPNKPFIQDRPQIKYDPENDAAKEKLRIMHYEAFEERKKRLMVGPKLNNQSLHRVTVS